MNLFYNPTLSELHALIQNKEGNFTVVVDNDGEVLVDQSAYLPESKLVKYKFYIDGLNANFNSGTDRIRSLKTLNQLYKNLLFCWEKGVEGKVNFQDVSRLQNMLYHKEINSLRKNDYPISINTYR